jgi:hypothetical protein
MRLGRRWEGTHVSLWTVMIGREWSGIEVIHDGERCYGFLRRSVSGHRAWCSGEHFNDHYIGEFNNKAVAIDAVVKATS